MSSFASHKWYVNLQVYTCVRPSLSISGLTYSGNLADDGGYIARDKRYDNDNGPKQLILLGYACCGSWRGFL
jgi:hypothetical protein